METAAEHFPAKTCVFSHVSVSEFRVRNGEVRLSLGSATCPKPSLCDARRRATSIWVQRKCEPHSSGAWWGPEALGVSTGQFWLRTTLWIHSFMNRFEHMRFHWNEELNYFSPKKKKEKGRNGLRFLCLILCIDFNAHYGTFTRVGMKMRLLYFCAADAGDRAWTQRGKLIVCSFWGGKTMKTSLNELITTLHWTDNIDEWCRLFAGAGDLSGAEPGAFCWIRHWLSDWGKTHTGVFQL